MLYLKKRFTILLSIAFTLGNILSFARLAVGDVFAGGDSAQVVPGIHELIIPETIGKVSFYDAALDNRRTIIHIQDAHCQYGVQKNISRIIQHFEKEYNINKVLLEGGVGKYDLDVFTRIKSLPVREKVSDYFLKNGLLNGAEYYAVNNPSGIQLLGIEDPALYKENLYQYRSVLPYKNEILSYLDEMSVLVNKIKMKTYSSELMCLEKICSRYSSGEISFNEYISSLYNLSIQSDIDFNKYTGLAEILNIVEKERFIDFKKAEKERANLIDFLSEKLSRADHSRVFMNSILCDKGEIGEVEFYDYIFLKANFAGLDRSEYSELNKYSDYLKKYGSVDEELLLREFESFTKELFYSCIKSEQEEQIYLLSEKIELLKQMFELKLTRWAFDSYLAERDMFSLVSWAGFILQACRENNIEAESFLIRSELQPLIGTIEGFYISSFRRDEAFLANIERIFDSRDVDTVMLITGGFHAENLAKMSKLNNMNYIRVIPEYHGDSNENPYFKVLSGSHNNVAKALVDITYNNSNIAIASLLSELGIVGSTDKELFEVSVRVVSEIESSPARGALIYFPDKGYFRITNNEENTEEKYIKRGDIFISRVSEKFIAENLSSLERAIPVSFNRDSLTYEGHQAIIDILISEAHDPLNLEFEAHSFSEKMRLDQNFRLGILSNTATGAEPAVRNEIVRKLVQLDEKKISINIITGPEGSVVPWKIGSYSDGYGINISLAQDPDSPDIPDMKWFTETLFHELNRASLPGLSHEDNIFYHRYGRIDDFLRLINRIEHRFETKGFPPKDNTIARIIEDIAGLEKNDPADYSLWLKEPIKKTLEKIEYFTSLLSATGNNNSALSGVLEMNIDIWQGIYEELVQARGDFSAGEIRRPGKFHKEHREGVKRANGGWPIVGFQILTDDDITTMTKNAVEIKAKIYFYNLLEQRMVEDLGSENLGRIPFAIEEKHKFIDGKLSGMDEAVRSEFWRIASERAKVDIGIVYRDIQTMRQNHVTLLRPISDNPLMIYALLGENTEGGIRIGYTSFVPEIEQISSGISIGGDLYYEYPGDDGRSKLHLWLTLENVQSLEHQGDRLEAVILKEGAECEKHVLYFKADRRSGVKQNSTYKKISSIFASFKKAAGKTGKYVDGYIDTGSSFSFSGLTKQMTQLITGDAELYKNIRLTEDSVYFGSEMILSLSSRNGARTGKFIVCKGLIKDSSNSKDDQFDAFIFYNRYGQEIILYEDGTLRSNSRNKLKPVAISSVRSIREKAYKEGTLDLINADEPNYLVEEGEERPLRILADHEIVLLVAKTFNKKDVNALAIQVKAKHQILSLREKYGDLAESALLMNFLKEDIDAQKIISFNPKGGPVKKTEPANGGTSGKTGNATQIKKNPAFGLSTVETMMVDERVRDLNIHVLFHMLTTRLNEDMFLAEKDRLSSDTVLNDILQHLNSMHSDLPLKDLSGDILAKAVLNSLKEANFVEPALVSEENDFLTEWGSSNEMNDLLADEGGASTYGEDENADINVKNTDDVLISKGPYVVKPNSKKASTDPKNFMDAQTDQELSAPVLTVDAGVLSQRISDRIKSESPLSPAKLPLVKNIKPNKVLIRGRIIPAYELDGYIDSNIRILTQSGTVLDGNMLGYLQGRESIAIRSENKKIGIKLSKIKKVWELEQYNNPRIDRSSQDITVYSLPLDDLSRNTQKKYFERSVRTMQSELETLVNRKVPDCYGIILASEPVDNEGRVMKDAYYDSPVSNMKQSNNRLVRKSGIGNVEILTGIGIRDALTVIYDTCVLSLFNDPFLNSKRIDLTISESLLKSLQSMLDDAEHDLKDLLDKHYIRKIEELRLRTYSKEYNKYFLREYLQKNTMLTIIRDEESLSGNMVPFRFSQAIYLSLSGLNLGYVIERIENGKMDPAKDREPLRDAVILRSKAMAAITNNSKDIDSIYSAIWREARKNPFKFIRMVSILVLPQSCPLDIDSMRESIILEAVIHQSA